MKVSILVPVFNAEKYLRKCLDSIVNQTYKDLQVVIVDDGSTDSSPAICDEYSERYKFLEVYRQFNEGVAAARNALLDHANGDYIIFVDSDDWIEVEMISDLIHYISKYDLDIAICDYVRECSNSCTVVDTTICEPLIECRDIIIKKFLLHKELNGSLWNKLVKTTLFHKLRFAKDIWYGEDALMMWQIFQRSVRVGTVPTRYYHYRMNGESISHHPFGPKKMSGHKVWERIYADTCSAWPQYERIGKAAYAISDMWLLYYAAIDKYPYDDNIRKYQHHVRKNFVDILQAIHIKPNKKVFALCMAISYRLGSVLINSYR